MTAAYTLVGIPIRAADPRLGMPCTCGVFIAGPNERTVRRLHAEHIAEQRNPDDHELEAW